MKDNQKFEYNYSSKEQDEIKRIRDKYITKEKTCESQIELLRKLDTGVMKKGAIAGLTMGAISTLILGAGMSLIMSDIGKILGFDNVFISGLLTGVIGLVGIILAFPLYKAIVKRERKRIAPQIIKITDDLLK